MQEATTHIERRQTPSRPGQSANCLLIPVRSAPPMVGPGKVTWSTVSTSMAV